MSDKSENSPLEKMSTVTAHLICAGAADAIEFYKTAFDAVELLRLVDPSGKIAHAGLKIGDSMLMVADEYPDYGSLGPKSLKGSPVVIHLVSKDVDATVARAVAAGAKVVMPVADMFWGDRYGQLEDPFGHRWSVATPIRSLTPAEMQAAMNKAMC